MTARKGVRLQPDLRWRFATLAAALGLLLLVGLLATDSVRAGPRADVTLNVSTYRNANGILATIFSGTVASDAAAQIVEIDGRDCGGQGFRSISSARTRPGGGYQVENPEREFPYRSTRWESGITYRARWNERLSDPYVLRLPAGLAVYKVKGRRGAWRVATSPPGQGIVSMKGKVVQLQRLRGAIWKTIARKPLVFKPRIVNGGAFNHEVVFKIPKRGWRLRAILPANQAAPCYTTGISSQWRS